MADFIHNVRTFMARKDLLRINHTLEVTVARGGKKLDTRWGNEMIRGQGRQGGKRAWAAPWSCDICQAF